MAVEAPLKKLGKLWKKWENESLEIWRENKWKKNIEPVVNEVCIFE